MNRCVRHVTMGLSLLIAVGPCSTVADGQAARSRLAIGVGAASAGNAGLLMAKEQGLFGRRGLDVELSEFNNSSLCLNALIGGDVAMCTGVGGATLVHAVAGGAEVVGIAALTDTIPFSLVVSPRIRTVTDLKGARLGINRFGGLAEFATRSLVAAAGLRPDDVTLVPVGSDRVRLAALAAGLINATALSPPGNVVARDQGLLVLPNPSEPEPSLALANLIIVTRTFPRTRPDIIPAFLGAVAEGNRYFKAHEDEGTRFLGRYLEIEDARVLIETYRAFSPIVSETLRIPTANADEVLDVLAATNPAVSRIRLDDLVEMSFVRRMDEIAGLTPARD